MLLALPTDLRILVKDKLNSLLVRSASGAEKSSITLATGRKKYPEGPRYGFERMDLLQKTLQRTGIDIIKSNLCLLVLGSEPRIFICFCLVSHSLPLCHGAQN